MISVGSLFSRESAPLLGIDISSSSVKLVELGRDKAGALVLERCAIEPLERGWITDGSIHAVTMKFFSRAAWAERT